MILMFLPIRMGLINLFVPNAPFLYHLKTSENLALEKGYIGDKWELNSTQLTLLKFMCLDLCLLDVFASTCLLFWK